MKHNKEQNTIDIKTSPYKSNFKFIPKNTDLNQEYLELEKNRISLLGNYNKNRKFIIERAEGCEVFDTQSNSFLDMNSGVCVMNLGHNPHGWSDALNTVGNEMIHVSNYFYNKNEIKLSNYLCDLVKDSVPDAKVFFCNSGTEANEAAIKFSILQNKARNIDGNILAFSGAFHGRTIGSLSCTYNSNYRQPFKSIMKEALFWEFNKTEGLEEFITTNNISTIISEPIQGENGVFPMTEQFAQLLKELHKKLNFIWIIDEIQVGLGRYGRMFTHQIYGIEPDYITLAKALGNGIPIGAVIGRNPMITPGQHGTTFGGNPFATGISYWVLNEIIKNKLPEEALNKGEYLKNQINLVKEYFEKMGSPKIVAIRGRGLLIGVQLNPEIEVGDVIKQLFNHGILCISAGNNTLRICPPLVITLDQINIFLEKLKIVLEMTTEDEIKVNKYLRDEIPQPNGKNIVWKISGDINEIYYKQLLRKFNLWLQKGYRIALIFGAGTAINNELKQREIKIEYINGQRKTTKEVVEVLEDVVKAQREKLVNMAEHTLLTKLIPVKTPIFTATKDKMETHGFVLEPESADVNEIQNIWNDNGVALVSFLSSMNGQLYNSNADICTSCLAIELKSEWIGYSVGHENDISQIESNNISLIKLEKEIKSKKYHLSDGFKMKIEQIKSCFARIDKPDIKCFIGNDEIPDYFNAVTRNGLWIRKKEKFNIGLIGSRGNIGKEIVSYIHKNDNFVLYRFSNNHNELPKNNTANVNYLEEYLGKKEEISTEKIYKLSSWEELNTRTDIDIWISACPNSVLKNNVHLVKPEIPIIDVSSDFRHQKGWEYGMCYVKPNVETIRISNPGCYSSACISALYPLSKSNKKIEAYITGVSSYSGAGKDYLSKFPSLHETLIPYSPLSHFQQREIEEFLKIPIHFVPIVTDQFDRGIVCSIQVKSNTPFIKEEIIKLYNSFYENNEFISFIWNNKHVITTDATASTTFIIISNFSLSEDNKVLHLQCNIDNLTVGGGFSTYLNLCRLVGVNHYFNNTQNEPVPVQTFDAYDNYLSSLTFPHGFKASTTNVPFLAKEINKKKVLQFTCIRMDVKSKWTALYTRNPICGHPVTIGRQRMQLGKPIKALWVNNKIANVGVSGGLEDAEEICSALANTLNCEKNEVIPLSTGVIGWKLPKDDIISHISYVVNGSISVNEAAKAIMTTDSYPKAYREKLSNGGSIVGIAKGAGMVEPNLATTIIVLMTDVDCEQEFLNKALKDVSETTFNCISIDGDTSTSDCAILVSSCLKTAVEEEEFIEALTKVCSYLARQIVWNGEGISHVIEVRVKNCPDVKTGKLIGKNIVNSPLTKSAICGNDPNIGRIIGSMARLIENVDWSIVNVKLGQHYIFVHGKIVDWDSKIETEMTDYLRNCQIYEEQNKPAYPVHDNSVIIEIEMNQGENDVTILGGDLTIDYVKINGNYRS